MNQQLADLFAGRITPGVYRWTSRASAARIAGQAESAGWRLFHLDGSQIATKEEFLRACTQEMGFPGYFGNNWDALEDSLRDLSWAPAQRGYLVLCEDVGRFAAGEPAEFAVAVDILRSAVESWRGTETPMVVLLRGAGGRGIGIPML